MATVYQLIFDLAKKSGVDISGDEFSGLKDLTTEVPAGIEVSSLMSEADAKKNPRLKTHFVGEFVNGVNQNLSAKLEAEGFTQDQIDAAFEPKSFTDRLNASLELYKGKKDEGKDTTPFKTRITALEEELKKTKLESQTQIDSLKNGFDTERIQDKIVAEFAKQPWSDAYDPSDRADLAKLKLNKVLAEHPGAKLIIDPVSKELKLVDEKNIDMDYFDSSNKPVKFTDVVEKSMTTFKRVSDQTDPNAPKLPVVPAIPAGQSAQTKHTETNALINKLLNNA